MSKVRYGVFLSVLLLIALGTRLVNLEIDPPSFFADGSQGLTTDGAYLTMHAGNRVLFGTWDLFGYRTWSAFKVSLITGLSYILFSIFGVSRVTANLAGVILNATGLILFVVGLGKRYNRRALVYVSFFLALNYVLSLYSRLPFSENALIFFVGLVFVVYVYWFEKTWGKILTGVLVGLCGLLGKSFGFLVILGPLLYLLVHQEEKRTRSVLILIGSFVISVLAFAFLFYPEGEMFGFLWEHASGEHGFPKGLQSIPGFFENLISFAVKSNLHRYSPVMSLLLYFTLLAMIISAKRATDMKKEVMFNLGWLLGTFLLMSPFNYLPLRYLCVLILPISVLIGLFLDGLGTLRLRLPRKLPLVSWALLFLLNWYFSYYAIVHLFVSLSSIDQYFHFVWYAVPAGVVITTLQMSLLRRFEVSFSARLSKNITLALLALFLLVHGQYYYSWWLLRTYTLKQNGTDVSQILGAEAVVSGQYGPALAVGGTVKSFPFFLTSDLTEAAQTFRSYPVTHLAIGAGNWKALSSRHPDLQKARVVAKYWLRDNIVYLVRVNEVFSNRLALDYQLSDYEQAVEAINRNQPDSARYYLDRFLTNYSSSKSGLLEKYYLTVQTASLDQAQKYIDKLAEEYKTDFSIAALASIYHRWLFRNTADDTNLRLSEKYLNLAIVYNRKNEKNLRLMYEKYLPTARILP